MQVEKYSEIVHRLDKKWVSQAMQSKKTIFLLKIIILYHARSVKSPKPPVEAKGKLAMVNNILISIYFSRCRHEWLHRCISARRVGC